jgi:hypothetical protein
MGTNFFLIGGYPDFLIDALICRASVARVRYGEEPACLRSDLQQRGHIGKRSGAGPYCHDCDITLRFRGPAFAHFPEREKSAPGWQGWYNAGQGPKYRSPAFEDEKDLLPPVAVEKDGVWQVLQKAKIPSRYRDPRSDYIRCPLCRKASQTRACSFSWAVHPSDFDYYFRVVRRDAPPDEVCIRDEYENRMTYLDFMKEIESVPRNLYNTESVGTWFS